MLAGLQRGRRRAGRTCGGVQSATASMSVLREHLIERREMRDAVEEALRLAIAASSMPSVAAIDGTC